MVWNPNGPGDDGLCRPTTRALTGPAAGATVLPDRVHPAATARLDCKDVRWTNFVVRAPDPHGFDGNHDGRGCEEP